MAERKLNLLAVGDFLAKLGDLFGKLGVFRGALLGFLAGLADGVLGLLAFGGRELLEFRRAPAELAPGHPGQGSADDRRKNWRQLAPTGANWRQLAPTGASSVGGEKKNGA